MTQSRPVPADRRLFLIGASSLLLTGCSNVLGGAPPSQIYLLRPALPSSQPGEKVPWALAIMRPSASDALDTDRIALARSDTQMDYYANAVWPDRLSTIVQTTLLAGFEASGRIQSVAREEDALRADYNLSTEIRDFEARYTSPDGAPTVVVTIIARMATARARQIVATFTANATEQASANSVEAVVQAFDAALAGAAAQIVNWALNLPPPPERATAADITTSSRAPAANARASARANVPLRPAPGGSEIPVPGSATPPAP